MPFRKIVAGVDETPAGVHALRAAGLIAEAAGAQLVALRIVSDPWRYVRPDEVEPLRARGSEAPADLAQARCSAELGQIIADTAEAARAEPVVRFGIPGVEVPRWAKLLGADLLVLGRQPLGTFERRPADRTIAQTLRATAVPCLIVPFGQRTWQAVLGVLDADAPSRVAALARAFAALWGAKPRMARFAPVHAAHGVTTGDALLDGVDPVGETIKLARAEKTDVVVVGGADRMAEDGVVWRLVQRAPCAILAVPWTEEEQ